MGTTLEIDPAAQAYLDAITPEFRPLFDRVHRLIAMAQPTAVVVLSYRMPTYRVGTRRLFVGVWTHGISIYGWPQGSESGFTARHPAAKTSKGTIRLRLEDAGDVTDDELLELVRAALD
jgi:uncharacterized protein YdhG (YjbR/CyaY superfamily)